MNIATSQQGAIEADAAIYAKYLREHMGEYFADFAHKLVQVRLLKKWERCHTTLYRFRLDSDARRRFVLVKVPLFHGVESEPGGYVAPSLADRPRLRPRTSREVKGRLEYAALHAIHDYFEDDTRFGTIRPLGFLPMQRAIVMEELRDPSFSRLFRKVNCLGRPFTLVKLEESFHSAGAWLRVYHEFPKRNNVQVHHTRREDIIHSIKEFTNFLSRTVDDERFFTAVAERTVAEALDVLPEILPLGLVHGDYAMYNILVGPGNRLTVLDTLAKYRAPIYEDIAFFLTGMKATRLQLYTQGIAFSPRQLARYEQQFLLGYFGAEPIPHSTIRIFEIQTLLDKWSSGVERFGNPAKVGQQLSRRQTFVAKMELAMRNRFFRNGVKRLLWQSENPSRRYPVTAQVPH